MDRNAPPSDLLDQLRGLLGPAGVLTGEEAAQRQRSYWDKAPMSALAIARPRSTEEVSAVLRLCSRIGVPVVAHGGRTGCAQAEITTERDLVLSLERMTAIEEIDTVGRTAVVQAGCTLEALQDRAAKEGLYLALDLGARGSCTVGGNVATNAGGVNVIRYGMARENVLGLEAVLADGTIVSSMNRMLKNNAGFDLKQLFIGTEGALGIVTRVVFRLREQLQHTATAMIAADSFDAVAALLKHLDRSLSGALTSFELMYGDYHDAVTGPGRHRAVLAGGAPFYVIAEATGANAEATQSTFEQALAEALEQGVASDAAIAQSLAERRGMWAIREDFEAILAPDPTFLYDVSLPLPLMEDYVAEVRATLKERFPAAAFFALGHIGDGNLHFFISPNTPEDGLHRAVDEIVYRPLAARGGSISAEHGVGLEKKAFLDVSRTAEEIALMRRLKQALDPHNILNPGKVFDLA